MPRGNFKIPSGTILGAQGAAPGPFGRDILEGIEQLLKLINDQQDSRHRWLVGEVAVSREILNPEFSENISALAELIVNALEEREPEFSIRFNSDGFRVREIQRGIGLEFNTLLKVHQIQLKFLRGIPK